MSADESRWQLAIKTSVASLLGLAILGHFGITAAYVAPPSPLKLKLQPVIQGYVEPYFTQHWELFAPDPIMETRLLMVSCRVRTENGGTEDLPYSNMTAPLRELRDKYGLTPADRIDRLEQGAIHLMFDRPDALTKKVLEAHDEGADDGIREAKTILTKEADGRRAHGEHLLTRISSAECDRLYGAGRTTFVRARMAVIEPPPFSERNHPPEQPPARYTEFDWAPYEAVSPL